LYYLLLIFGAFVLCVIVYVDECVYESERVCRLCTWCMWV